MDYKEKIVPTNQTGSIPDTLTSFTYFYLHGIKNAFVNALRTAFSDESIPAEYRYHTDSTQSQIAIYKNFPQRIQKLPLIVVETGTGSGGFTFLSDEILFETSETENGYLYGGVMTLNVDIIILTQNIKDIEKLTDLVYLFLRFVFREKFQANNIAYNKIEIKGETTEDNLYKNTISTKVTCDFTNFIPKSIVQKIEQINIDFNIY